MRTRSLLTIAACASALVSLAPRARADNTLRIVKAQLDPPTVISLGVQVLIAGDDDFNTKITMRYRKTGDASWRDALPLFRVHNELVVAWTTPPQFAGSIFELSPDTPYDIELHATDPDGNVDQTLALSARTRPVPRKEPSHPRVVNVSDTASLTAAVAAAKAGDVITLAKGTYAVGTLSIGASGTADDPIFLRGVDRDGVMLDGAGCAACNVIDAYGSFVTIENLTIQNAQRAIRWQTDGATNAVLRRVHITNVDMATFGKGSQHDFYICDNVVEGRMKWPFTYAQNNGASSNNDGIVVNGDGMVLCHNTISGFADALQNRNDGTRSNDFYGNDILWNYDDGIEMDGMEGNARAFRNRWTNTFDTTSFQPIYGGPAYLFRNVVVNVEGEQMKLHAQGPHDGKPLQEPIGVVAYNNTFVRAYHAMQISTPNVVHHYVVENNLFIGPAQPQGGRTVAWDTPMDAVTGTVDYNGYFPEGKFEFGYNAPDYPDFASVVAAGKLEKHGVLLGANNFANGLVAPIDHHPLLAPQDVALATTSAAIDKGIVLANVTDGFVGAAPDLGAIELGCKAPTYGPRPPGVDETIEPRGGCGSSGGDAGGGDDGGGAPDGSFAGGDGGGGNGSAPSGTDSGCGCNTAASRDLAPGALALLAIGLFRMRRRRRDLT